MSKSVLIVAGGTGGHIYPALAVAHQLHRRGVSMFWLGSRGGLESRIVPEHGYPLFEANVSGLRGGGALRWLLAPLQLSVAVAQALLAVWRARPMVVLGMGGFVSGPGGVAAWLCRRPLVIHEQNARAGLTNLLLTHVATRVLQAFPGTFPAGKHAITTGNPVREEISALPDPRERLAGRTGLRLLVFGGSRGAQVLNERIPEVVAGLAAEHLTVWHQTGAADVVATRQRYQQTGVDARVMPYIEDMAAAYAWADLAICRAGAITVAELAAAGVGAILVPYPHAVDDHQAANAEVLTQAGAAVCVREADASVEQLREILQPLCRDRGRIEHMATCARGVAVPDATARVAGHCLELLHV